MLSYVIFSPLMLHVSLEFVFLKRKSDYVHIKTAAIMSMTKRKRRREVRDHAAARRFYLIVGIATVMLILLLYLVYRSVG